MYSVGFSGPLDSDPSAQLEYLERGLETLKYYLSTCPGAQVGAGMLCSPALLINSQVC